MPIILKTEAGQDATYYSIKEVCELTRLSRTGLALRIDKKNAEFEKAGEPPVKKKRKGNFTYISAADVARIDSFKED